MERQFWGNSQVRAAHLFSFKESGCLPGMCPWLSWVGWGQGGAGESHVTLLNPPDHWLQQRLSVRCARAIAERGADTDDAFLELPSQTGRGVVGALQHRGSHCPGPAESASTSSLAPAYSALCTAAWLYNNIRTRAPAALSLLCVSQPALKCRCQYRLTRGLTGFLLLEQVLKKYQEGQHGAGQSTAGMPALHIELTANMCKT